MKIELEPSEQALRDSIAEKLNRIRNSRSGIGPVESDDDALERQMGDEAHRLHAMLAARGKSPKHHKYMIENRGMLANDPEFYDHVHPVEDLLGFIDDDRANDDPEDQTIGDEFTFVVFSPRWGHDDTYRLTRTSSGWDVRFNYSGPCDKRGRPLLYRSFHNDSIKYPSRLEDYLEWLWNKAAERGLSHDAVQDALNVLAKWVIDTTRSEPSGDLWQGC